LESLVDQIEFFVVQLESLVIEDGSESSGGDETALALVFILEEWLDQEGLSLTTVPILTINSSSSALSSSFRMLFGSKIDGAT